MVSSLKQKKASKSKKASRSKKALKSKPHGYVDRCVVVPGTYFHSDPEMIYILESSESMMSGRWRKCRDTLALKLSFLLHRFGLHALSRH